MLICVPPLVVRELAKPSGFLSWNWAWKTHADRYAPWMFGRTFGHEHSATAILEQRLREAITTRNWPLVGEIAKKLAKQDRQAG